MSQSNPETPKNYMHDVDVKALHGTSKQTTAHITLRPAIPYTHPFDVVEPVPHTHPCSHSGQSFKIGDVVVELKYSLWTALSRVQSKEYGSSF